MATSGWETDDEAETGYTDHVDDEESEYEESEYDHRRKLPHHQNRNHAKEIHGNDRRNHGRHELPKPSRSFYEVERVSNNIEKYPAGPEVRTRLKHSGYPEHVENRFRVWSDPESDDEDKLQRIRIGMPTSSYGSALESEIGDGSGVSVGAITSAVESTEQFLLTLQNDEDNTNATTGSGEALAPDAVSDTDTVKGEEDGASVLSHDGDLDVSHYVRPSLFAQKERAWKAHLMDQAREELPNLGPNFSEDDSRVSDMESLQNASVASEMTSSLPPSPRPSSVAIHVPHHIADELRRAIHPVYETPKSPVAKDPIDACRVEDVQILSGDSFSSESRKELRPRDEYQDHFDIMRRFLSNESQNSPLIDLRIRVQGRDFQTHRLLMVTYSRYFQELNDEGHLKPHCIVIMDALSPEGFARVLEWINSAKLDLNSSNVEEVLRVARTLGVKSVVEKCQQFLTLVESQNDAPTLYEYAVRNGLQGAVHENGFMAASCFPEICRTRKYLQYTVDQLCLLLDRDDLQIDRESDVYHVACDWLLHAWDSRHKHVPRVMQCVRFHLMSPSELKDIVLQSRNPIAQNVHVISMLLHALLYLSLKVENHHDPRLGPMPTRRTHLGRNRAVDTDSRGLLSEETIASHPSHSTNTELRGRSSLATDQKEILLSTTTLVDSATTSSSVPSGKEPKESSPSAPTTLTEPEARVGRNSGVPIAARARHVRRRKMSKNAAAIKIQAGYRGHVVRKQINELNDAATAIQKVFRGHLIRQELLVREKAAAAIQRGYRRYTDHKKYDFLTAAASYSPARRATKQELFMELENWPKTPYFHLPPDPAFVCFGGITSDLSVDPGQIASCIYGFDIQSDEWQLCGIMPEPRADAAACLLGSSIILTGGYDPRELPVSTSTAWKVDIFKGEWETLPSMLFPRRLHGQVIVTGKVYVVGGCGDGSHPLDSTETFDPQQNRWIRVGSLEVPRFAAAVASHGGKIWVCGGIFNVEKSHTRKITHLVEVYDPIQDKWLTEKPLPAPRAFCDLASVDDTMLIIAGGVEGSFKDEEVYVTSTILSFDFEQEKWRYLMNLPGSRYKAKVVSRDPYWFVVGGESTISGPSLSTVECFDTHDQRWVAIPHLPVSLHGTCCISLS